MRRAMACRSGSVEGIAVLVVHVDNGEWAGVAGLENLGQPGGARPSVTQLDPAVGIEGEHLGSEAQANLAAGTVFPVDDDVGLGHRITGLVSQPRATEFVVRRTAGVAPGLAFGKSRAMLSNTT